MRRYIKLLVIVLSPILLDSCDQDFEDNLDSVSLNSFNMILEGDIWVPSAINDCKKLFSCSMSELDNRPFYQIKAYRDPDLSSSLNSENFLEIQIMDVTEAGSYTINESFGDFTSYSRFRFTEGGKTMVYENMSNGNSFHVDITELLPRENSALVGIKGLFSGTLYNIEDSKDSIQIESGEFAFEKINWNTFNQCAE